MKVWVLSRGCRYEGGTVVSVHTSLESGQSALDVQLKEYTDELAAFRQEDDWWNDERFDMKEERPGHWCSNSDFISLQEWEAK